MNNMRDLKGLIKEIKKLRSQKSSSIDYSAYLAENIDKTISYSEYISEHLDKNISYSEYLSENLSKGKI
jgi:hypothetical protein